MTSFFVDVEIETDAQTLADDAIDRLKSQWPGWEPNDGDLEVVQIEAIAPMAANAAEVAARMPAAALRTFGTKLLGEPFGVGSPARTTVTFPLVDTTGYTIPANTEIEIDGYSFTVDVQSIVPSGLSAASGIAVTSLDRSEEVNGLTGTNVSRVSALAFVTDPITLDAPTAGGSSPQTDAEYQNTISRRLLLQAKTLVTPRDYVLWALDTAGIGRAYAVHTGDRAVTVVVATEEGEIVADVVKDLLTADYALYRLVNTVVTLEDPTYTTIDVVYEVKALPGFVFADLEARIDAMLAELLSPAVWGRPKSGESTLGAWLNDPIVRANVLIDRIADVEGVDYVAAVSIEGDAGLAEGSDWIMDGTYALPRPGTMTGGVA